MDPVQLNWLAILLATVVVFVGGAVWYSPLLFAGQWSELTGMTTERMREGPSPTVALTAQAALTIVAMIVLAMIISWSSAGTILEGLTVGAIVAGGLLITDSLKLVFFEQRPPRLFLINNGYNLLAFLVAGGILGAWR